MAKNKKKFGQILEESGYQKINLDLAKDNFVLRRQHDNKQVVGQTIKFVEWNDDGTFKSIHSEPAVGRSIIVDPGPFGNFRWLTTTITEMVSTTEFKTKNSTYNIYKL